MVSQRLSTFSHRPMTPQSFTPVPAAASHASTQFSGRIPGFQVRGREVRVSGDGSPPVGSRGKATVECLGDKVSEKLKHEFLFFQSLYGNAISIRPAVAYVGCVVLTFC